MAGLKMWTTMIVLINAHLDVNLQPTASIAVKIFSGTGHGVAGSEHSIVSLLETKAIHSLGRNSSVPCTVTEMLQPGFGHRNSGLLYSSVVLVEILSL